MIPNPFDPAIAIDPYPAYARIREAGRVLLHPQMQMWLVSGYHETAAVLKDHESFSSRLDFGGSFGSGMMILNDPPDHARLRGVVSRAFTPRSIAALEPRIRAIAGELIRPLRQSDGFDVVEQLAVPLPVTVIAEMLGVDAADRDDFKRWSDAFVGIGGMAMGAMAGEFHDYVMRAIAQRRKAPGDDLISRLILANADAVVTDEEIVSSVVLLLVAGNETTTNLVSLATFNLCRHPGQRDALVHEPALISNAVEEVLRFDGPVHAIPPRTATSDVDIGPVCIPKGAMVMALPAAANRDPVRFPDADTLDVRRPDAAAHVAFGSGIHFCLGAPLARLEGRLALEALLAAAPRITLADPDAQLDVQPNMFVRSIARLPVRPS